MIVNWFEYELLHSQSQMIICKCAMCKYKVQKELTYTYIVMTIEEASLWPETSHSYYLAFSKTFSLELDYFGEPTVVLQ